MQTEIDTKECLNKEKDTGQGLILLWMVHFIRDNGKMGRFKEKECALGKMADNIRVNG